ARPVQSGPAHPRETILPGLRHGSGAASTRSRNRPRPRRRYWLISSSQNTTTTCRSIVRPRSSPATGLARRPRPCPVGWSDRSVAHPLIDALASDVLTVDTLHV